MGTRVPRGSYKMGGCQKGATLKLFPKLEIREGVKGVLKLIIVRHEIKSYFQKNPKSKIGKIPLPPPPTIRNTRVGVENQLSVNVTLFEAKGQNTFISICMVHFILTAQCAQKVQVTSK